MNILKNLAWRPLLSGYVHVSVTYKIVHVDDLIFSATLSAKI